MGLGIFIAKNLIVNPGSNGIFHILRLDTGKLIYSDILPKTNELAIFNNNDIIANPIFYDGKIYVLSHSWCSFYYNGNFII